MWGSLNWSTTLQYETSIITKSYRKSPIPKYLASDSSDSSSILDEFGVGILQQLAKIIELKGSHHSICPSDCEPLIVKLRSNRRGIGGIGIRSSRGSWRRRLTQRCLQFGCDKMCVSDQLEEDDSGWGWGSGTRTEIQTASATWG